MILVISESEDKSCDDVAEILADNQVDFQRINEGECGNVVSRIALSDADAAD